MIWHRGGGMKDGLIILIALAAITAAVIRRQKQESEFPKSESARV
jgi:hypothetical protein